MIYEMCLTIQNLFKILSDFSRHSQFINFIEFGMSMKFACWISEWFPTAAAVPIFTYNQNEIYFSTLEYNKV